MPSRGSLRRLLPGDYKIKDAYLEKVVPGAGVSRDRSGRHARPSRGCRELCTNRRGSRPAAPPKDLLSQAGTSRRVSRGNLLTRVGWLQGRILLPGSVLGGEWLRCDSCDSSGLNTFECLRHIRRQTADDQPMIPGASASCRSIEHRNDVLGRGAGLNPVRRAENVTAIEA